MIDEENAKVVDVEVKAHFAPKKSSSKEIIDPKVRKHFVDMLERQPHMWLMRH
jgi:hypothetical protein